MSWLRGALMVADIAMTASNANQIHEMREEGKAVAAIQVMLQELKNQIFNFNESAKDIFEKWDENPKISAGAMALLKFQLDRSGITPDIFIELGDKEYVSSTHRSIQDNVNKMLAVLPDEDKDEIGQMLEAAHYVTQSNYYLENLDDVSEWRENKIIAEKLGPRNSCGAQILGSVVGLFAIGVLGALAINLSDGTTGQTLFLFGIGAVIFFVLAQLWQSPQEYRAAQKRFDELNEKLNIDKYETAEQKLGQNQAQVQRTHDAKQLIIQQFFGDSQLRIIAD